MSAIRSSVRFGEFQSITTQEFMTLFYLATQYESTLLASHMTQPETHKESDALVSDICKTMGHCEFLDRPVELNDVHPLVRLVALDMSFKLHSSGAVMQFLRSSSWGVMKKLQAPPIEPKDFGNLPALLAFNLVCDERSATLVDSLNDLLLNTATRSPDFENIVNQFYDKLDALNKLFLSCRGSETLVDLQQFCTKLDTLYPSFQFAALVRHGNK